MERNLAMRPNMRLKWAAIFFLTMYSYMMLKADWISDPDIFWHIEVGNFIWSTFAFPHTDFYSHTMFGEPWIAKEWLSQIILASVFNLTGWQGLAIFSGTICALSLTLLFFRFLKIVKWTIAVGLVWIAMPFLALSFMARPQIFSFLLFAIALLEIDDALHEGRRPHIWIFALSILWVNMHASFPILIVLLTYGAFEAYIRLRSDGIRKLPYDWLIIIGMTALGFCITPYGLAPLRVAFEILQFDLSPYITEWRPIALDHDYKNLIEFLILSGWLLLICIASIVLLMGSKILTWRLLPIGFFAIMSVKHVRFCTMLSLTSAVMIARAISVRYPNYAAMPLRDDPQTQSIWRYLSIGAIGFAILTSVSPQRPDPKIEPQAALAFAKSMQITGDIYNSYNFGGFLIANGVKTMVDGRTELYFDKILRRVLDPLIKNDEKAFRETVAFVDAEWAMVMIDSNESKMFDRLANWKPLYKDNVAALYQRIPD